MRLSSAKSACQITRLLAHNKVGEKMYPSDYLYTNEHEWVRVEGDLATVGITDYAQHELGDVVYVELPKPGTKLKAGESLGTVESVKAVSDIYAPVSGEVTEVNSELKDTPETINKDPHGKAWLIKLKLANSSELSTLMNAAAYEAFLAGKQKEASA
jgi:glycine cleavage system H protein